MDGFCDTAQNLLFLVDFFSTGYQPLTNVSSYLL